MRRRRGIVLTVVVALVAGGVLLAFVVSQSAKPGTKVSLGTNVFSAGSAKGLAKEIDEGGPIQFARASTHGPDIYLQHLGSVTDHEQDLGHGSGILGSGCGVLVEHSREIDASWLTGVTIDVAGGRIML